MTKKKALTLTEVIIATAIAGTIAAITINTLMSNNTSMNRQYVTALKKTYINLNYAVDQIRATNGGTLSGAFDNVDEVVSKLCTYLKCSKICTAGQSVSDKCTLPSASYSMLDGGTFFYSLIDSAYSSFVLSDGTTGFVKLYNPDCTGAEFNITSICGFITIDINGFKKPNIVGKDGFGFYILKDFLIPAGGTGDLTNDNMFCNPAETAFYTGIGCTGKVLKEGIMDY